MSQSDKSYPARYARRAAERLVELLTPYCERIEIAGSLRRGRAEVHDIDLVIIPAPLVRPEFGSVLRAGATLLDTGLAEIIATYPHIGWWVGSKGQAANGDKLKRLTIAYPDLPERDGLSVDLYLCTAEAWATTLLIRTGSKEHNILLCRRAALLGGKLHADGGGLFGKDGNRLAGDSEESIFAALGMTYLPPARREVGGYARSQR